MAVSQTSFEARVKRINKGQTVDASAPKHMRRKNRRSLRQRCMNVPFFTGVGILTGMPAYAFVSSEPNMNWVWIEVQKVLSMVA